MVVPIRCGNISIPCDLNDLLDCVVGVLSGRHQDFDTPDCYPGGIAKVYLRARFVWTILFPNYPQLEHRCIPTDILPASNYRV